MITSSIFKFRHEHPEIDIKWNMFCDLRPDHIEKVSYMKMKECLCTDHQNFGHLIKALKKAGGFDFKVDADEFADKNDGETVQAMLDSITCKHVGFEKWKRAYDPLEDKYRQQLKKQSEEIDKFKPYFKKEFTKFSSHKERVVHQYTATRALKQVGPGKAALCMDFSESYTARESRRSTLHSHWNKASVLLHPMVLYYWDEKEETVKHQSYVYISHVDAKDSTMVFAMLKKFWKNEFPKLGIDIDEVFYITDGPTSQYRNKFMFWIVANHKELFGITAQVCASIV